MLNITVSTPEGINGISFGNDVVLEYILIDAAYALCNLDVEYSENSGLTWNSCTPNLVNPLHEVPVGLASSPGGIIVVFS